jgi:hypothetical protein
MKLKEEHERANNMLEREGFTQLIGKNSRQLLELTACGKRLTHAKHAFAALGVGTHEAQWVRALI